MKLFKGKWDELFFGNICISSAHSRFTDMAQCSSHSADFLWHSNLGFEAAEGLSHSCCEATPTLTWQHVWVLLEEKSVGLTLRPLALRNLLSLRFACVWTPALFLWTSGKVSLFSLAWIWSCTIALRGMGGVRGLISSARFQQTQHFASVEAFWISLHQTAESFASCSQSSARLLTNSKLLPCGVFQARLTSEFIWRLCCQCLSWHVILSWLKNTGVLSEWSWGSWLPSWPSFLAGCFVWSKTSSRRSPGDLIFGPPSFNGGVCCWLQNLLISFSSLDLTWLMVKFLYSDFNGELKHQWIYRNWSTTNQLIFAVFLSPLWH